MEIVLISRSGLVLTMNDALRRRAGRRVDSRWAGSPPSATLRRDAGTPTVIDAHGAIVLPGFVQTHMHLCQTLFRGSGGRSAAARLAAHARVAARGRARRSDARAPRRELAAAELLLGGTTTVLTMETVHDTDAVFEALVPHRAARHRRQVPDGRPRRRRRRGCIRTTRAAIDESLALHRRWSGAADGRLRAALAPRFAISCTRDLLEAAAEARARARVARPHARVGAARRGRPSSARRRASTTSPTSTTVGLATPQLCVAHCVWATEAEQQLMAERDVKVLHCPGSNLKLGSGIAPVTEMRARGISVSLGADGAACNNRSTCFRRCGSPRRCRRCAAARARCRRATWCGWPRAKARGRSGWITRSARSRSGRRPTSSSSPPAALHQAPGSDPYSTLVYASAASDVRATIVDGVVVAREGQVTWAEWPPSSQRPDGGEGAGRRAQRAALEAARAGLRLARGSLRARAGSSRWPCYTALAVSPRETANSAS